MGCDVDGGGYVHHFRYHRVAGEEAEGFVLCVNVGSAYSPGVE